MGLLHNVGEIAHQIAHRAGFERMFDTLSEAVQIGALTHAAGAHGRLGERNPVVQVGGKTPTSRATTLLQDVQGGLTHSFS